MWFLLTVNGAALRRQSSAARVNTALYVESHCNLLWPHDKHTTISHFYFLSIRCHYKTVGDRLYYDGTSLYNRHLM